MTGSPEFHSLLRTISELHDRKQADYGKENDPFANVRSATSWGIPASLSACIRIGDKVARLQTFYRKGVLANESVEDAFMDLAVYALIGLLLYREESEGVETVAMSGPETEAWRDGFQAGAREAGNMVVEIEMDQGAAIRDGVEPALFDLCECGHVRGHHVEDGVGACSMGVEGITAEVCHCPSFIPKRDQ